METAKTSLSQGLKERKKSKLKTKKKKKKLSTATPAAETLKLVIGLNTRPKKKRKNEIGMRESNKQRVWRTIRRSRRRIFFCCCCCTTLRSNFVHDRQRERGGNSLRQSGYETHET
jgi:hypothetical protein